MAHAYPGHRSGLLRTSSRAQPAGLIITRKGGKVVTIPLAPRTALAIDPAIGERCNGAIFRTRFVTRTLSEVVAQRVILSHTDLQCLNLSRLA
jgi:hypothetical protein